MGDCPGQAGARKEEQKKGILKGHVYPFEVDNMVLTVVVVSQVYAC